MAESIGVMPAIQQAMAVDGVNLMSATAGAMMRSELESMYSTRYILTPAEQAEIQVLCGYPVRPLNKKPRPSCHWQIAVLRDMLRKTYTSEARPETTRLKTLVVASAHREISLYWKNPNVDFYVYGKESKDGRRVVMKILEDLREEVVKRAMLTEDVGGVPVPKSKRRAVLNLQSIDAMLAAYQAAKDDEIGGARIFTRIPEGRKYEQILVEDGHYNFRDRDWLELFYKTGASQAWVIGMLPYELLFEGAPASTIYKSRVQRKPGNKSWDSVLLSAFIAMELGELGRDGMGWIGSVLCGGLFYLVRDIQKRKYDVFVRDGLRYFSQFENFSKTLGISCWRNRITAALQAVWDAWSEKMGSTELVMTYHGHSNGYIHDRDAMMTLLETPWMGSVRYNFALHSEIYQRLGPMSVVHIGRADLEERVVRELCLNRTEKYVRVLDLFASYDFLNDVPREPVYFAMRQHEYFDVIDFLSSQKPMSISVQTAMLMVRRASAGLSLGKTQLTPPWRCEPEVLYRVAANAALVALERAQAAEKISDQAFKEMITGEEPRWVHYAKTVLAVGACVATAGLAIPIFGMYFWLTKRRIRYPLYERGQDSVYQEDGAPGWASYAKAYGKGNDFSFDVEVPMVDKDDRPTIESECDFIALLGDVGKQDPVCMHARGQCGTRVDLSMSESQVAEFRAHLVQGRDASPNDGIAKTIDQLIDVLNRDKNGYTYDARVELVRGPPGVGKSYTMRGLMKRMIDSGRAVAVHSPFGKLSVDYSVANEALGQPAFPFFTQHKLYKVGKLDLMVVEEYTNMDERLIAYMAYRTGAQVVVMVGDEQQTGLMPTEGDRPFVADGILRLEGVREHILPINFRSDAYTVALLNAECGYCIYAANDEVVLPEVLPTSELDIHTTSVMTFSKATAHEAQQPVGDENTVRKNQGQTHEGTHILLRDGDEALVRNNALFCVAVSRRKVGTGLTVYSDTSEVEATMRARLRLDDRSFLDDIQRLAKPDYRAHYERIRAMRFGPDVELKEGQFASLLRSEGCWREEPVRGDTQWAKEFFAGLWKQYEEAADRAVPEPAVEREAPKKSVDEQPMVAPTGKQWCTLDAMVQYRMGKRRSAPYSNVLRNEYIRAVVKGVPGKQVPINFLLEWLRSHSIRHLIFDTRDGSYQGDWNGTISHDAAGYAKPLYLVDYNGYHVEAMTRARISEIVKKRKVKISNAGLVGTAEYCDFWTVQDFEIWNNVTLKGGIPRGIRMGELFRMTDLVAVKENYLSGGSTGIEIKIEMHQDAAGGIGLYGPDDEIVDSTRVEFRNALATAMADEQDYSLGGTAFIQRADLLPERVVRERELAGGADGWTLAGEVDVTYGPGVRSNAIGAAMGSSKLLQRMTLARDPLYVRLDKKGRVLGSSEYVSAFSRGFGNTQTDAVVETLGAADRYFVRPKGTRESVEGRRHAIRLAEELYWQTFDAGSDPIPQDAVDGIQRQFERDALNRSYDVRAQGLWERSVPDRQVTFMNKVQFKWGRKTDPLAKEAKVGQGISATSSAVNLRYGGLFRQADHAYATQAQSWNIFDCYMTRSELVDRVNAETDRLPACTSLVTTDAEEFDSAQNWHSARAEARLNALLVGHPDDFEAYIDEVRTNYPVSAPGLFSGRVQQAKPSGAPDTLGGNTRVSDLYTHHLVEGRGPRVVLKKGDDKMINRYGQRVNRDKARKLACYSPLNLTITEGDNQFCGLSATARGLFENFVGVVRKALARGSRDYKSWAEYQIALRDFLKEVHRVGVTETVLATASAMGVSVPYVWDCYTVVQSLAHISEKQWLATVHTIERNYPAPRTAGFIPRPWGC